MKQILTPFFTTVGLIALMILGIGYCKEHRQFAALRDSIDALVPDTVILYDTIEPENKINWIDSVVPKYVTIYDTITNDSVNFYNDSIVNEEIAIYVQDKVKGLILSRDIGYRLKVPKIIKETTKIEVPYPVIQPEARRNEFYYGFSMGFSREGFAVSGGLDVLTKKNIMYGAGILRTESKGYLMLNLKFKF